MGRQTGGKFTQMAQIRESTFHRGDRGGRGGKAIYPQITPFEFLRINR